MCQVWPGPLLLLVVDTLATVITLLQFNPLIAAQRPRTEEGAHAQLPTVLFLVPLHRGRSLPGGRLVGLGVKRVPDVLLCTGRRNRSPAHAHVLSEGATARHGRALVPNAGRLVCGGDEVIVGAVVGLSAGNVLVENIILKSLEVFLAERGRRPVVPLVHTAVVGIELCTALRGPGRP